MAAPKGNINALKNGKHFRADMRFHLALGELPKPLTRIKQRIRQYRRQIEDAVAAVHGNVDIVNAHRIDEICTWELHAMTCKWLLKSRFEEMSANDIASCSRTIAQAKTASNKALTDLRIDRADQDAWQTIFDVPSTPVENVPRTGIESMYPEPSVTSADVKPTTDTTQPHCASEATAGEATIDPRSEEPNQ